MIPYFIGGITTVVPTGHIDLNRMLQSIRSPTDDLVTLIARIRHASQIGDKVKKQELKAKLPYFTPAVNCTYRNYKSITKFNGIAVLDFDKLESNEVAKLLKQDLFHRYDQIISAWLSASGTGVRALFKVPICHSVNEYKEYYLSFSDLMQTYVGYDNACVNPIQPLYYSFDTDILVRDNATTWNTKKYRKPQRPGTYFHRHDRDDDLFIRYVKDRILNIQEDGHPRLFSIVKYSQNFIDAGYVTRDRAVEIITATMGKNPYLDRPHKKNDYLRILNILKDEGEDIQS